MSAWILMAGAVVCDADLWVLGAEPHRYAQSVSDLRTETGLEEAAWATTRRHQLTARLAGPIYHTPAGVRREALRGGRDPARRTPRRASGHIARSATG